MAKLWALQILAGKKVFEDVPNRLKAGVSKMLEELRQQNEQ